jgi:hypothetical protein
MVSKVIQMTDKSNLASPFCYPLTRRNNDTNCSIWFSRSETSLWKTSSPSPIKIREDMHWIGAILVLQAQIDLSIKSNNPRSGSISSGNIPEQGCTPKILSSHCMLECQVRFTNGPIAAAAFNSNTTAKLHHLRSNRPINVEFQFLHSVRRIMEEFTMTRTQNATGTRTFTPKSV